MDRRPTGSRLGGALLHVAAFVGGFLVVAGVVRALLPPPDSSGLGPKLEHYREHADDYDVVFVGSSHVLCSVVTPLFEQELARRGHALRAYNLGVPGMLSFETDHLVAQVLEARSPRLRWVVVELSEWQPDPRLAERVERTVYWHTPERTAAVLECAARDERVDGPRLARMALDHGELLGRWLASTGRLQRRLALELGAAEPDGWAVRLDPASEGGYAALEELDHEGADAGRALFLDDLDGYRRRIQAMGRDRARGELRPSLAGALERRLALFEGTGVRPVHVIFAGDRSPGALHRLADEGLVAPVWSFDRPAAHRELYEPGARFDSRHLNRRGAEHLTRLLAERFAELLESGSATRG